ncbi:MAG: glycosyltransferase family 39 protein [Cyclobacteriaceae bacterium]|nr:glycosyltransferase family 39 protein [Cyclobacteriaceae bacterium]
MNSRTFQKYASSVVFVTALLFRLILVFFVSTNYMLSDSIDYHNLAVNLVEGNGYSQDTTPPFRPSFYREPAHPLYLALAYGIYKVAGGDLYYMTDNRNLPRVQVTVGRIFLAILGSLTVVLFFWIVRHFLQPKVAFWVAIASALYFPLAFFTTQLMRETVQTFSVTLASLFFLRYLSRNRIYWLALFSFAWALSNMTLQITVFVVPLIPLWMKFNGFRMRRILWATLFSIIVALLFMSPWLFRTYRYYPDIRVFKTLGISQTYEFMAYVSGERYRLSKEYASSDSVDHLVQSIWKDWYKLDDFLKFQQSFDGTYKKRTAVSLPTSLPSVGFTRWIARIRNCWIESFWFVEQPNGRLHMRPHSYYWQNREISWFALSLIGLGIGWFAVPGIFLFSRRLWPCLLLPCCFLVLFPLIGSEPRRGLPVHLFILLFSGLTITYSVMRISGSSHLQCLSALFKSTTIFRD